MMPRIEATQLPRESRSGELRRRNIRSVSLPYNSAFATPPHHFMSQPVVYRSSFVGSADEKEPGDRPPAVFCDFERDEGGGGGIWIVLSQTTWRYDVLGGRLLPVLKEVFAGPKKSGTVGDDEQPMDKATDIDATDYGVFVTVCDACVDYTSPTNSSLTMPSRSLVCIGRAQVSVNLVSSAMEKRISVYFNGVAGHIANARVPYGSEDTCIAGGDLANLPDPDPAAAEVKMGDFLEKEVRVATSEATKRCKYQTAMLHEQRRLQQATRFAPHCMMKSSLAFRFARRSDAE